MPTKRKAQTRTKTDKLVRTLTRAVDIPRLLSADDVLASPTFPTLLDYLRLGAHLSSACAACMLPYRRIMAMMQVGSNDETEDAASRSIFLQVTAAVGDASVVSEAKVRDKDPLYFLKHGSRRLLGDEWNSSEPLQQDGRTDSTLPLPSHTPASDNDLLAAIEELRRAGIVTAVLPPSSTVIDSSAQPTQ